MHNAICISTSTKSSIRSRAIHIPSPVGIKILDVFGIPYSSRVASTMVFNFLIISACESISRSLVNPTTSRYMYLAETVFGLVLLFSAIISLPSCDYNKKRGLAVSQSVSCLFVNRFNDSLYESDPEFFSQYFKVLFIRIVTHGDMDGRLSAFGGCFDNHPATASVATVVFRRIRLLRLLLLLLEFF